MLSNSTDHFRHDINALRAIAIISVVAYHYGIKGFSGGFVGVDIFFVISGFLISSHIQRDLQQNRFSYRNFYLARVRRIFPALAVMSLVCAVWGWFYSLPNDYLEHIRHELEAVLFVSNYAFNSERGYFDAASHTKPLLHTWSLSVEAQFYLLLPLCLQLLWRFIPKHTISVIIFIFLISFAWCIYFSQVDAQAGFYQLTTRIWEFIAGTLLAIIPMKQQKTLVANTFSIISLLLLIVSVTCLNTKTLWPSYYTVLPVLGSVVFIFTGETVITRWFFNSWLMQRLGDISYSLYLWHWPVWVFASLYVNTRLERELSELEILGLIYLALTLAILSWRFVELPTRFKKAWWSNSRVVQGSLLVLSVFVALTIRAAITKGFPNRLPDYVQRGFTAVAINTPRNDCFRNEASQKQVSEQFCQFGAKQQPPSLLLWGDSHANMYLTALSNAANITGKSGYIATQTGCRATQSNQANDLTGAAATACTQFNNEVNDFLIKHSEIQTIIIARLWGDRDSLQRTLNLIQQLLQQGKTIILVGPVPFLEFSVPEYWIYQQLKAGHAIDVLTNPSHKQQHLFAIQQTVKQQLATPINQGRVIWIEPLKTVCPKTECVLVYDGISYFKDVTHLSEAGAMLFTNEFATALRR